MALIDITPKMTSNTMPSPYIVKASSTYSNLEPWKAFNKTSTGSSDGWRTANATSGQEHYIQFDFSVDTKVNYFKISPRVGVNDVTKGNFKEFNLVGSYDETDWELIGNFQTENADQEHAWHINTQNYRVYRINIFSNYGSSFFTVSEIGFYYDEEKDVENIKHKLTINKTLKENLPDYVDPNGDEIHFTENGEIYISKLDGTLQKCSTEIIKEISNPLTTQNLQYGCFRMSSDQTTDLVVDGIVKFDTIIDGNIDVSSNRIMLLQGKTYKVDGELSIESSGYLNYKIIDNNGVEYCKAGLVSNKWTSGVIPARSLSTIIQPTEDIEILVKIIDISQTSKIRSAQSYLTIQEVRNNPVNQYGGFETEVLFEGNASTVGSYELMDNINNYDFIIPTYKIENNIDMPSIIPKMTSNTTPSPYVAKASSEASPAYAAFNNQTGTNGQVWYSTTGFPHWLSITNNEKPMTINAFSITNGTEPSGYSKFAPKTFTFEGSNDGKSYEVIKEFNISNLSSGEIKTFSLDKEVSYKSYKLNITDGYYVDNHAAVIIGELKLFNISDIIDSSIIPVSSINNIIRKTISGDTIDIIFSNNNFEIAGVNNLSITKVIGLKGQLPSLLSGGTF